LAYNRTQASKLLGVAEMALFELSLADRIRTLSAGELHQQIKRARIVRDKASDLLKRQALATQRRTGSKTGPAGDANERTQRKLQIMSETLARFEKRLAVVEPPPSTNDANDASSPSSAGPATAIQTAMHVPGAPALPERSTKAPAVGPVSRKLMGPGSDNARAMAQKSQFQEVNSRAIQGHVSVVGRHNQAKRDGRG